MIVDPPSGWKYGFPKKAPDHLFKLDFDTNKWFRENGYPQSEIDQGMLNHCRYWFEEEKA